MADALRTKLFRYTHTHKNEDQCWEDNVTFFYHPDTKEITKEFTDGYDLITHVSIVSKNEFLKEVDDVQEIAKEYKDARKNGEDWTSNYYKIFINNFDREMINNIPEEPITICMNEKLKRRLFFACREDLDSCVNDPDCVVTSHDKILGLIEFIWKLGKCDTALMYAKDYKQCISNQSIDLLLPEDYKELQELISKIQGLKLEEDLER